MVQGNVCIHSQDDAPTANFSMTLKMNMTRGKRQTAK